MSTDKTVRDLTRLLTQMETRIKVLEQGSRTSQLQNASITGTAITVYDEDGETRRGSIGIQADGTIGFVAEGGPAPSATTVPVVTPSIAGLKVVWDGLFADGSEKPADFDHVAVHVSTSSGFTPSAATFAGTITVAGNGGVLPVAPLPYVTHYVQLVGVNTSAVAGPASAEASGTPIKVDGPDLTAGSVTAGAIAAGAVTADKLEAILSVANRIVAGDPAGARVELNSGGLSLYDGTGVEKVKLDSATGDAVFTGTVTGSTITGGQLITDGTQANVRIYDAGTVGLVEFTNGSVHENKPARFLAGLGNTGAVNEYAATNLDGPSFQAPADAYVQMQLNSQSADNSSNANVQFFDYSATTTNIMSMDKGLVKITPPVQIWNNLSVFDSSISMRSLTSTSLALSVAAPGDAFNRYKLYADGAQRFGPGTADYDVTLRRSAAGTLQLTGPVGGPRQVLDIPDGRVYIRGADTNANIIQGAVAGDTVDRYIVFTDGWTQWSDGTNPTDLSMYRDAPRSLKVNGKITADNTPVHISKPAHTDRASTTTFTDDPDFQLSLAANSVYRVEMYLHFAAMMFSTGTTAAGRFKTAWRAPTGATGNRGAWGPDAGVDLSASTSGSGGTGRWSVHNFSTSVEYGSRNSAGNQCLAVEEGTITTVDAGTLALQWAQVVSYSTASRLASGSYMRVTKIA